VNFPFSFRDFWMKIFCHFPSQVKQTFDLSLFFFAIEGKAEE
jgi:hypothetical protein